MKRLVPGLFLALTVALTAGQGTPSREKASASLEPLTRAIEQQTNDAARAELYFHRARVLETLGVPDKALADVDKAIELQANAPAAYQFRGTLHFRAGKMRAAIADFNTAIGLRPDQEAHHWQRGIAYYYAGEFERGRRQFEMHQEVNPNDVENAVWHFLCVARMHGMDEARKKLIPISGDSRVPMAEVHDLFSGKGTKEDVLEAAAQGDGPGMKNSLFYAHLYLGLFEEARGNDAASLEHIRKAAHEFSQPHYMGDVA